MSLFSCRSTVIRDVVQFKVARGKGAGFTLQKDKYATNMVKQLVASLEKDGLLTEQHVKGKTVPIFVIIDHESLVRNFIVATATFS